MAVENDYNVLGHTLNELAQTISDLRDEVQNRRELEAEERRQPNETDWVELIGSELLHVEPIVTGLRASVNEVLASKPGVPVFRARPPRARKRPPET